VIELPAAAAMDSAAATGAAAIAVAAKAAMKSGAMNFRGVIMYSLYHFPVNLKPSRAADRRKSRRGRFRRPCMRHLHQRNRPERGHQCGKGYDKMLAAGEETCVAFGGALPSHSHGSQQKSQSK
jgi:hypothetical protein